MPRHDTRAVSRYVLSIGKGSNRQRDFKTRTTFVARVNGHSHAEPCASLVRFDAALNLRQE
jgi:hypothetical protein